MRFFSIAFFLFFLSFLSSAQNPVYERCVNVYGYAEGDPNYSNGSYNHTTIKANASKEIVLIGNSYVFRISKEGNKLWENNLFSTIYDFAIDKDGSTYFLIFQGEYKLIKYYSNGTEAWQKQGINGQFNKVKVDDFNNVYLTGVDYSTSPYQLIVRKYAESGTQLWTKWIPNLGNGVVTVASSGEVYVLAEDWDVGGYQLFKYSTTGTVLWQRSINYNFWEKDVVIGQDGNVYLFLSDQYSTRIMKMSSGNGTTLLENLIDLGSTIVKLGQGNFFYLLGNGFFDTRVYKISYNLDSEYFILENNRSTYYRSIEVDTDGSILNQFNTNSASNIFVRISQTGQVLNKKTYFNQSTTGLIVDYQGNYLLPTTTECVKKITPCDKIDFSIVSNPVNKTVCVSSEVFLGVTATGNGLRYRWVKNNEPLSEGSKYSGVTSPVLTISSANPSDDSGYFSCYIVDVCGRELNSADAYISFIPSTNITTQPISLTQCQNTEAVFQIATTGGQNVKYQWRKGTTILTESTSVVGTTTNRLALKSIAAATAGDYYCYITSDCFTVPQITQKGVLTVLPGSAIISQPQSVSTCSGTNAVFTLSASGTNLTYQWRKGTVNLTESTSQVGVNTNTLTIRNVTSGSAGDYNCVISSTCGNITTNTVALSVTASPQLTAQPASRAVCTGTTITFSITATGASGYVWKRNDVVLANTGKYSGVNTATLTINAATVSEAGTYTCIITNPCGNDLVSTAAQLTIATSPSITAKSANLSLCVDQPAIMSIAATGSNLTYQWKKNGINLNDAAGISGTKTSELIITKSKQSDAGNYTCEVSSGCGASQVSGAIVLVVQSVATISQPQPEQVCQGEDALFSVFVSGTVQSYQWKKNGVNLANNTKYSGVLSATLTIKDSQPDDQAFYTCEIRTSCSTTIASETVQLLVNPTPDLELLDITCDAPFVAEWNSLVMDKCNTTGTYTLLTEADLTPVPDLMSIPSYGVYIIVKNAGVCTDSVVWDNTCIITGVDEETQPVVVFPNPSTGLFYVKHPSDVLRISVFDAKGIQILATEPNVAGETGFRDKDLPQGLYLVITDFKNGSSVVRKLIVSR
ncbi:MAG: hypothetical protein DYG99_05795 [Bacteroidetes bacterium CHB5]|nr:hypothetical protein [Bacteroidetes bacterium CHB5]